MVRQLALALTGGLLLMAVALTAPAQDSASIDAIASQAQYWEVKGRYDLARDSWLKLLRVSPDNAAALAGLAKAEAKSGRAAAAQVYVDRLKEAHPEYPGIRAIEDSIRLGAFDQTRVEEPRALARAGDYEGALAKFRAIYGNEIPGGRLGLEYYQVLAGTKGGWSEARSGIENLVKTSPDDAVYKLALAQHLTYQEDSRRQGISDLSQLAASPAVSLQAKQAWRQSLIWLGAKKGVDEKYYRNYLSQFGDDAQVRRKLEALEQVSPGGMVVTTESGELKAFGGAGARGPGGPTPEQIRGDQVREAYDALNNQDLEAATQRFEALLASAPNDADALGGLGIIRLRQQNYSEARQLLEQAGRQAPKSAKRWKEALDSARFWEQVRLGDAAREAGRLPEAERIYRAALALDAKRAQKEFAVRNTLADVLAEQGDTPEAERIYRDIVARQPEASNAMRGLIGILTKDGRLAEAIALAEKLPPEARAELGNLGALKGQYLREQAKLASENKDEARAESLLKEALLLDPESPWTRLELARIYQRQHRVREANTLIDGLLTSGRQLADAIYIKALLLAEQQDWYNALTLLEQVPPMSRAPEMFALQRRLWTRYQTERASLLAKNGRPQEAVQVLSEVEAQIGKDSTPELIGALAQAWADIGDDGRALMYMRQALSRTDGADPGMRLQYASLLFKLRQDAEFEVVMEDLVKFKGWEEAQSVDLANLRIAYRLRQADLVREDGDLARAYEYLEPLLRVNPNDPRLLMALARLYNDAKEYDRCLALYQRALQIDGKNLDAYKGAIGAALSLQKGDLAEEFLDKAFVLDPENPRLYALAGRAARLRGEDGRALELFQQALRLDQASGGSSEFGGDNHYSPKLYLLDPYQTPVPVPSTPMYQGSLDHGASPLPRTVAVAQRRHQGPDLKPGLRISGHRTSALGARFWRAVHRVRDKQARLIKVSTPPSGSAPAQPEYIPPAANGSWVRDGENRYSYTLQQQPVSVPYGPAPSAAPAPAAQSSYEPRTASPPRTEYSTVFPRNYQRLSSGLTQPRRGESLRQEVLRDINDLTRRYPQETLQDGYPQQQMPSTLPGQGAGVMYEVPRIAAPDPYAAQRMTSSMAPSMDVGASVQAYERQGVRVLSPAQAYPGYPGLEERMGTYPYSDPQPPVAVSRPYAPMQLRQDPLLSTPSFVLERRRPRESQPNEVVREIASLQAKRSTWFGLGLGLRNRDGVSGLDRLSDIEFPVEFSFAGTQSGRIKLRAVPVILDAGTVSGSQLPLFGTLALVNEPTLSFGQAATGVALGAAYEAGDFRMDFGTTPLGFPVENLVGGINWQPRFDRIIVQLDLARRAITDSKLAYAGAHDPGLGRTWGGVTKTGGRLDVAYDLGEYGIYGNSSYHFLDGQNTAQNSVYELGAGLYARAYERRDLRITWGLNLTSFFYDKNLRRFTYGHGGYFSPQSYLALSVPVELEGGRDRYSYKLNGSIGIQGFRENGSALYPNDSNLQLALADFAANNPDVNVRLGYNAQSSTGLGFTLGGTFEYLLAPNVIAGARLSLDNARDYTESSALGYMRYLLSPQVRVSNPPAPLYPFYNFGDPRL